MPRVLVTGATGLIGSQAPPLLLDRGWEVHALTSGAAPEGGDVAWHQVDLGDAAAAEERVRAIGATHLLHFAWSVTPGQVWTSAGNARWVEIGLRLVRAFAAGGGERAVLAGSCGEYAWSDADCAEHSTPIAPRTFYGVCKDALRRVVEGAAPDLGLSTAWGRIFFVYGPGEHPDRLVAAVARALLRGEPAETTHGTQVRDYLHSRDVASAFVHLLEGELRGPVNVGSGTGVALRDMVLALGELTGRPELVRLGARAAAPYEPPRIVADVGRLRDQAGWRPGFDLRDGLADTLEWWAARASAPARRDAR